MSNQTMATLYLAVQHIKSKKMQSIVATLGVGVGISMFIVMINFMTGVNNFLENSAFDGTADLRIFDGGIARHRNDIYSNNILRKEWTVCKNKRIKSNNTGLKKTNEIIRFLNSRQDIYSFSPHITCGAIFMDGEKQVSGSIFGVNFEQKNHTRRYWEHNAPKKWDYDWKKFISKVTISSRKLAGNNYCKWQSNQVAHYCYF